MCFLRATDEGKAKAQSLADLEGDTFPRRRGRYQDMGFQGDPGDGRTSFQPKPPPGGARTPPEQARHRARSAISMRIEHASGGVKR